MSKAWALCAVALPIPPNPRMPNFLPSGLVPFSIPRFQFPNIIQFQPTHSTNRYHYELSYLHVATFLTGWCCDKRSTWGWWRYRLLPIVVLIQRSLHHVVLPKPYRINSARGVGDIYSSLSCSIYINLVVASSVWADELDTTAYCVNMA
jgi:hypothetical protein